VKSRNSLGRGVVAFAGIASTVVTLLLLLNVGGGRARLWARYTRVENWPTIVPAPAGFQPKLPPGFKVSVFATGFVGPRWLAVSPNGDVFVADSAAGEIIVLHGLSAKGEAESRAVFADHLNLPFGIAFHGDYVYVADTDELLRFGYDPVTSKRLGTAEQILDLPGFGYHQHWTRSLAFSQDGQQLFVSVGSQTNVSIEPDPRRAAILMMDPDGKHMRPYATGLRNAVGIACNPDSGAVWASVNERDDVGDDIPSDYFTHIVAGGFYGWPYAYDGGHPDNRVSPRPDLAARTATPDVMLGAHVAPLQFAFYDKDRFPSAYRHGAFIAEHGSWNRRIRSGYQVVFIPFRDGHPAGEVTPFFSGFVPDPGGKAVYGRMVGVAVTADGALLISDDAGEVIWRVSYDPSN
jgi:glucose/arabinose dehydrogenase